MAQPIKETPLLTGKDAQRFIAEMEKPKHYSKEEKEQIKEAREICKKNGVFL
jgi:hypothetical protein